MLAIMRSYATISSLTTMHFAHALVKSFEFALKSTTVALRGTVLYMPGGFMMDGTWDGQGY
jgi:hypothetical protein